MKTNSIFTTTYTADAIATFPILTALISVTITMDMTGVDVAVDYTSAASDSASVSGLLLHTSL